MNHNVTNIFDASKLPRRANAVRVASGLGIMAAAGAALADSGIDTSAAVSTLTTGIAAISAIGAALLALTVIKKLWSKVGGG